MDIDRDRPSDMGIYIDIGSDWSQIWVTNLVPNPPMPLASGRVDAWSSLSS